MEKEEKDLVKEFAKKVAEAKSNPPEPAVVKKALGILRSRGPQWALTGLSLAKTIGTSLPGRGSTPIGAIFQTLGTIGEVRSALWKTTTDPVAQYAIQYNLEKLTNETFVRIFFGTDLHTRFLIYKVRINDYKELIDAQGPLGRFAFTKSDYSSTHDTTFYMGKDVQMGKVLEGLWTQYNGRLHTSVMSDNYGRSSVEFNGFDIVDSPLFGSASARMDLLSERHCKFRERKIPRSYVCYGPPGTGKTSFAMKFAALLGKRTLKLGAASLNHISLKDIDYLLKHLAPDFLIIDDVDKIQSGNALPTLLDIVAQFKSGDGRTTLIMTANTIVDFDPGFFRPNRIDTWLEFKLPDIEERTEVLSSYAKLSEVKIKPTKLAQLASESEGLSHDYLRELVSELKHSGSFEEVIALTQLMKKLIPKPEVAKTVKKDTTEDEADEGKGL